MLLVLDFTSCGVPHAKSKNLFVNDLIITIYENKEDKVSDQKQMFAFVEGALVDFWQTYIPHRIKKVYIFSDGGPHHFKIWKTINCFHYLVKMFEIPVEYDFFESYHGSSLCDAHAGHVKKSIRYLIQNGTKITELPDLKQKLEKLELKNATFEILAPLETTIVTDRKRTPGLKKFYKFLYDGKVINMFLRASDNVATKTINFDN